MTDESLDTEELLTTDDSTETIKADDIVDHHLVNEI